MLDDDPSNPYERSAAVGWPTQKHGRRSGRSESTRGICKLKKVTTLFGIGACARNHPRLQRLTRRLVRLVEDPALARPRVTARDCFSCGLALMTHRRSHRPDLTNHASPGRSAAQTRALS